MKQFFAKFALVAMVLSLFISQSASASSEKFLIEGINQASSTQITIYFLVNTAGVISNENQAILTATTYATEDDLVNAEKGAVATWANNNGYTGVTAADVFTYKPALATVATTGVYTDLLSKPSLSTVATSGAYTDLTGKPSLSTVATSGAYTDLTGKPSLATVATSGAYSDLTGKPSASVGAYEGTTQRIGAFPIFKSVSVSSGSAVFYLTADGTSTGTALFPNGVIADSVNAFVSDATASYQMAYAFSNGNKTLTVTTNKLTTANILTGILGQSAANGAVVKLQVWGY